jgi:hypothetical protein
MALPNDFSSWEHFQNVWRRIHNRNVAQYFRDVGPEDWDPDINTSRGSLRVASTIDDNDTAMQAIARWLFFHGDVRGWDAFTEPIYGVPVGYYHQTRKFRPQIGLFFREDARDVEEGYTALRSQICFRLINESSESITRAELERLGNRIKTEFGAANGYRWHRGKTLLSYYEPDKGYKFRIYSFTEGDGRQLIDKVLSIQGHNPDWKYLTINENAEPTQAFPTVPPTMNIIGKRLRAPRTRPSGYVRFQYAVCSIWGATKPVPLFDRSYRFLDPLVAT